VSAGSAYLSSGTGRVARRSSVGERRAVEAEFTQFVVQCHGRLLHVAELLTGTVAGPRTCFD
jgi:hypothetical protein